MAWVKISDDFYDHFKFDEAGPLGLALWTVALAYANRNLTDGFIPRSKARTLLDYEGLSHESGHVGDLATFGEDIDADYVINLLLAAGLWETTNGGYLIHDYLDFQPSADEVKALREARTEAGKKGATKRWSKSPQ